MTVAGISEERRFLAGAMEVEGVATKLRRQARSLMEFGNEGETGADFIALARLLSGDGHRPPLQLNLAQRVGGLFLGGVGGVGAEGALGEEEDDGEG